LLCFAGLRPSAVKEHTALAHATIERRTRDATRILREHIERTGRNIQAALQLSTK
jgi:DNA-binding GntR family transcriptional regulator